MIQKNEIRHYFWSATLLCTISVLIFGCSLKKTPATNSETVASASPTATPNATPTVTPSGDGSSFAVSSSSVMAFASTGYQVELTNGSGIYELVSNTCAGIVSVTLSEDELQGNYIAEGTCSITVSDGITPISIAVESINATLFNAVTINSVQTAHEGGGGPKTSYNIGLNSSSLTIASQNCTGIATVALGEYNEYLVGSYVGPGVCVVLLTDGSNSIAIEITSTNNTAFTVSSSSVNIGSNSNYQISFIGGTGNYSIVSQTCTGIVSVGLSEDGLAAQGSFVGPGTCAITVSDGTTQIIIPVTSTNTDPFSFWESNSSSASVTINSVQARDGGNGVKSSYSVGLQGGTGNYSVASQTCTGIATVSLGEYNEYVLGNYVGAGSCSVTLTDGLSNITLQITSTNNTNFAVDSSSINIGSNSTYSVNFIGGSGTYSIASNDCNGIVTVALTDDDGGVQGAFAGPGTCTITVTDGSTNIDVSVTSTNTDPFTSNTTTVNLSPSSNYSVNLSGGTGSYSIVSQTCTGVATVALGEYDEYLQGSYVASGSCSVTLTDGISNVVISITASP